MVNNSDFSDRTDALAAHLSIRIAELTERLGLSRDSLMGYRTGRYSISSKAWRKLETAEAAAGIKPVAPAAVPAAEAVYAGGSQAELAQKLRAQAIELLAMAKQLERMEKPEAELPRKTPDVSWMKPGRELTPLEQENHKKMEKLMLARLELADIERTIEAAEDLPMVRTPVVRRRA